MTDKEILELINKYAADKLAEDCLIIDVSKLSSITNYFFLCSGKSEVQLKAIRDEIVNNLVKEHKIRAFNKDGEPASNWIVLDYGSVIAHLFHEDLRAKYDLEELWSDAPQKNVDIKPATRARNK